MKQRSTFASHFNIYGDVDVDGENGSESTVNILLLLLPLLPAATKLGQGNIFTSVCLSTVGEGCLPQCMLGYLPSEADPPGADTPPGPPPGSRLQHTVNERPVRILLECILVLKMQN